MCKNFREKGSCKYGDRCLFAHGDHELTKRGAQDPNKVTEEVKTNVKESSQIGDSTIDSTLLLDKTD